MAHIMILEGGRDPRHSAIAAIACRGAGHVTTHAHVDEGLPAWLADDPPDLVLVDLPRPGLDASWLDHLAREAPGRPLLALTCEACPETLAALAHGPYALVLTTPVRPSSLTRAVGQLLARD